MLHPAPLIPLLLQLPVTRNRGRMGPTVRFLIAGVGLPPFPAAVANSLGIFGVRRYPALVVFRAAPPLALSLEADSLIRAEPRRFEWLLAIAAVARQAGSSRIAFSRS
jgi:hypothetical protein